MIRLAGMLAIALVVAWAADRYLVTDERTRTQLTGIKEHTRDALEDTMAVIDDAAARLEKAAPEVRPSEVLARATPTNEPKPGDIPEPAPITEPAPKPEPSTPRPQAPSPPVPEQPTSPAVRPAPTPTLDAFATDANETPGEAKTVEVPGPLTREEVSEVQSRLDRVMGLAAGRGW